MHQADVRRWIYISGWAKLNYVYVHQKYSCLQCLRLISTKAVHVGRSKNILQQKCLGFSRAQKNEVTMWSRNLRINHVKHVNFSELVSFENTICSYIQNAPPKKQRWIPWDDHIFWKNHHGKRKVSSIISCHLIFHSHTFLFEHLQCAPHSPTTCYFAPLDVSEFCAKLWKWRLESPWAVQTRRCHERNIHVVIDHWNLWAFATFHSSKFEDDLSKDLFWPKALI